MCFASSSMFRKFAKEKVGVSMRRPTPRPSDSDDNEDGASPKDIFKKYSFSRNKNTRSACSFPCYRQADPFALLSKGWSILLGILTLGNFETLLITWIFGKKFTLYCLCGVFGRVSHPNIYFLFQIHMGFAIKKPNLSNPCSTPSSFCGTVVPRYSGLQNSGLPLSSGQ